MATFTFTTHNNPTPQDTNTESASGTITTSDPVGNAYTITGVTGSGNYDGIPFTITGLNTTYTSVDGTNAPPDNTIFYNPDGSGPYLDTHGFAFNLTAPIIGADTFNISYANGQYLAHDSAGTTGSNTTGSIQTVTVAEQPLCFASGTLIRTTCGDVAVERLAVGNIAVTASGETRRITWIGHREVDCAGHARPWDVHPVRILAGAFGGGLPERDLFLSPGHPVPVGDGEREVLVPIMCLINGTSIERAPVGRVTYWHVELETHDILLAEGLPAESFIDLGTRAWFERGGNGVLTDPDLVQAGRNGRCRPVALSGPAVEAERRRLDTLFHAELDSQCGWPSQTADGWLSL